MAFKGRRLFPCYSWLHLIASLFVLAPHFTQSDDALPAFRFATHYEDHLVLQRTPHRAVLWGFGEIGRKVLVQLNDVENHTTTVQAGPLGLPTWRVTLNTQDAGGPHTITATSDNGTNPTAISLTDVYFGDVYLCGGQSNMQFTVNMAFRGKEEAALAENYPEIRMFTVARVISNKPVYEFPTSSILQHWSVASNESIYGPTWQYFSAVCWIFGRKLYDQLKIPIGLISSNYGGTKVEPWSSPEALLSCNISTQDDSREYDDPGLKPNPNQNSVLWNAMITPLLNTTIFGVIWYQGESNEYEPTLYKCLFPAMVADWRKKWKESSGETEDIFPFGFVQLCSHAKNMSFIGSFPEMRWMQTAGYGYVPNPQLPNTFMAVTIDLPDPASPFTPIHPRDKTDVSQRLFLGAMAIGYKQAVQWSGKIVEEALLLEIVPNYYGIIVHYKDTSIGGEGIELRSKDGFEVLVSNDANDDSSWQPAEITGYSSNYVTLSVAVAEGEHLSTLRYAWRDYPCLVKECAVYAKDSQLPSPPFIVNVTLRNIGKKNSQNGYLYDLL